MFLDEATFSAWEKLELSRALLDDTFEDREQHIAVCRFTIPFNMSHTSMRTIATVTASCAASASRAGRLTPAVSSLVGEAATRRRRRQPEIWEMGETAL
jgi:hypothetical protein